MILNLIVSSLNLVIASVILYVVHLSKKEKIELSLEYFGMIYLLNILIAIINVLCIVEVV